MNTRLLRDIEVSAVGFGCMGFHHGYGSAPEREEAVRLIRSNFCTQGQPAHPNGHIESGESVRYCRATEAAYLELWQH
jgi:hypothetical protein